MPAHSTTARTAPPAMTPVPGEAGRSKHLSSPMLTDDLVWDGGTSEWDLKEVLASEVVRLANSFRDLLRFAVADSNPTAFVADDD